MIGYRIVLGSHLKVKKPKTDDEIVKNEEAGTSVPAIQESADGTPIQAENQNEVQIVSDTSLNLTTN